jgi:hypothetical protein
LSSFFTPVCVVSTQQKVNLLNKFVIELSKLLLYIPEVESLTLVRILLVTNTKLFSSHPANEFRNNHLKQATTDSF